MSNDEVPSYVEQVKAILAANNDSTTFVYNKSKCEYTMDYNTEYFLAKAFVKLYPYGRGAPAISSTEPFKLTNEYLTHCMHLGNDRPFQKCPNFYFYAYQSTMKKNINIISHLADKQDKKFSVQDIKKVIDYLEPTKRTETTSNTECIPTDSINVTIDNAEIYLLMNKLKPFIGSAPGTSLFFQEERRKLMALINSPLTNDKAQWRYFFTMAQADMYLPEIYMNAITSSNCDINKIPIDSSYDERLIASKTLSKQERLTLLRDHPFLSARIFDKMIDIFFDKVINGKDLPLGKIVDIWIRIEFQERQTPHMHSLLSVETEEPLYADIDVEELRQKLLDMVEEVTTANLTERVDGNEDDIDHMDPILKEEILRSEKEYNYNIDHSSYFKDNTHPSSEQFSSIDCDFTYRSGLQDPKIKEKLR
jgi:hypothetical protein